MKRGKLRDLVSGKYLFLNEKLPYLVYSEMWNFRRECAW